MSDFEIAPDQRQLATYICGNPGSGKSSLLQHQILWDVNQGNSVCVIDPTKQLIKVLITHIPKEHLDRVIYFNTSMGVPLDFFSAQGADRNELIDDLVNIIDLGDAKTAKEYLANAITVFFAYNDKLGDPAKRLTIFDVPEFMLDDQFRASILTDCPPKFTRYFPPFIKYNGESINALITRMSKLARYDELETILGAKEPKLNISRLIDENKILLIDLKEHSEPDAIIGSIIAAKIQHAIFNRANMPDLQEAKPYCLYIDECDVILKFAASRFKAILGRARKYNLCMTIANPSPSDLPEEIQTALAKIGNLVLFNLDPSQSQIFRSKIAPFDLSYLTNLPKFAALFRSNNEIHEVETLGFLRPLTNKNAVYVRDITLRDYKPPPCKSEPPLHTSEDGTHDESPKETKTKPIQADKSTFGRNRNPR